MNIKKCRHCDMSFRRDDAVPIPHDRCERCHEEIEALGGMKKETTLDGDFGNLSTSAPQYDPVNHPEHYQSDDGIECIDAIGAATVGKSGIEAVCTANVIKYLWRYERKNGVEDLRKARWYLERLIKELDQ